MGDRIYNLKQPNMKVFGELKDDVVFPNITEIIDKNWGNKKDLVKDLSVYEKVIQDLYKQAIGYSKLKIENEKLNSKVIKLEREVKITKSDVEHYKNELYKLSIKSKMPTEALNNGIKDVLEINPNNKESIERATTGEFDKYFQDLFD
ncbi:hypothetical protein [Bacillus anthracis]